jgi:hypothetical protein
MNAPAYQEYAANMLAELDFRTMSLQERGLLWTLRLELWVNRRLPADTSALAKVLGLEVAEVNSTLTDRVKRSLAEEQGFLICPSLEEYREAQVARRQRQSSGGSRGGRQTQSRAKSRREQSTLKGNLEAPSLDSPRLGSDTLSNEETSQRYEHEDWVREYESGEVHRGPGTKKF